MKTKEIKPEYVEYIPEKIEEGVLYISQRYRTAVHMCCCGCGQEVVTPLSPAEWSVKCNGGLVSMWPSIGNWSYLCHSHYVIRDNRVLEAMKLTEQQIKWIKAKDSADRTDQIRRTNYAKVKSALDQNLYAKITSTHELKQGIGWFQSLICWWKSL